MKKYNALRIMVSLNQIVGTLLIAGSFILGVIVFNERTVGPYSTAQGGFLMLAILVLLGIVFFGILLIAIADVYQVLMDIEENTRISAEAAKDARQEARASVIHLPLQSEQSKTA